jgi:hypothetical protein
MGRMVPQPAVADRVHLLARPDERVARLRLPAGTLLRAGADAAGQLRLFAIQLIFYKLFYQHTLLRHLS